MILHDEDMMLICRGLSSFKEIKTNVFYPVIGNPDYDVSCWWCNPTGSVDCFEYKDLHCHPRAIAKTCNDDVTSKKVRF